MGNLTKIVLVEVVLPPNGILTSLLSNCHQLEELTFWGCIFEFPINIISPTLCRLILIDFGNIAWILNIDALNLSSFEYRGQLRIRSIKAPKLLNLFWNTTNNDEIPHSFDIIASLHQLQNLSINLSHSQVVFCVHYLCRCSSLLDCCLGRISIGLIRIGSGWNSGIGERDHQMKEWRQQLVALYGYLLKRLKELLYCSDILVDLKILVQLLYGNEDLVAINFS
ncbi:hypothetical protein TSUD_55580 [Trifolium subterraneum]|uniref:FBD domain-containing protein n=1 Tax=Trifolium subterraneum TaxID=3900 RepID=A0A2Z6M809_TRISU|nr:hypothetical protein TSUD_55580 [Trifolium subterraneum]